MPFAPASESVVDLFRVDFVVIIIVIFQPRQRKRIDSKTFFFYVLPLFSRVDADSSGVYT